MNIQKNNPYAIDISQITKEDLETATFIDVREFPELESRPVETVKAVHLPLSESEYWDYPFEEGKKYFFFCEKGGRSTRACEFLKEQGITNTFSITGGADAVNSINL